MASEYEKLRLQNLQDNKRILAELGLLNPFEPLPRVIKKAPKRKRLVEAEKKEKKYIISTPDTEQLEGYGSVQEGTRRRSSRIIGQAPLSEKEIEEQSKKWGEEGFIDDEGEGTPNRKSLIKRPMVYGAIPGVEVGSIWPMRIHCNSAGIHRPTVAGIHGGPQGAYSIVLSGGYEDNIDLGTCFTYTGEGGRDLKGTKNNPKNLRTAPQSKDQSLSKGNEGLVKSVETSMPVRVIRGFKLTSPFAPEDGYRYDGIIHLEVEDEWLYKVEKWWYTTGLAGYGVYKFALKRLEDQAPPPWTLEGDMNELQGSQDSGFGSETVSEAGSDSTSEKGDIHDTPEKNAVKEGSSENKLSVQDTEDMDQKLTKKSTDPEMKTEDMDPELMKNDKANSVDPKDSEKTSIVENDSDNGIVDESKNVGKCPNTDNVDNNTVSTKSEGSQLKEVNVENIKVEEKEVKETISKELNIDKEKVEAKKNKGVNRKKVSIANDEKDESKIHEEKENSETNKKVKVSNKKIKDEKTPQKNTLFKYFNKV